MQGADQCSAQTRQGVTQQGMQRPQKPEHAIAGKYRKYRQQGTGSQMLDGFSGKNRKAVYHKCDKHIKQGQGQSNPDKHA